MNLAGIAFQIKVMRALNLIPITSILKNNYYNNSDTILTPTSLNCAHITASQQENPFYES